MSIAPSHSVGDRFWGFQRPRGSRGSRCPQFVRGDFNPRPERAELSRSQRQGIELLITGSPGRSTRAPADLRFFQVGKPKCERGGIAGIGGHHI
jgi:hypothetical protein